MLPGLYSLTFQLLMDTNFRWLNRLQNGVFRLQSAQDLTTLSKNHDLLTILYFKIKTPPQKFQSASNFSKLAYHYLDGDPSKSFRILNKIVYKVYMFQTPTGRYSAL